MNSKMDARTSFMPLPFTFELCAGSKNLVKVPPVAGAAGTVGQVPQSVWRKEDKPRVVPPPPPWSVGHSHCCECGKVMILGSLGQSEKKCSVSSCRHHMHLGCSHRRAINGVCKCCRRRMAQEADQDCEGEESESCESYLSEISESPPRESGSKGPSRGVQISPSS